jgi:hypothetical protein
MQHHHKLTMFSRPCNITMLLGDGARKEAAGVEQYVLVRGD